MTTVRERDELHRLIDRLTPGQARHLLTLAKADPALAAATEEAEPLPVLRATGPHAEPGPEGDALRLFDSFVGIMDSGRGDLAERHEEIIREGIDRREGVDRPA